LLHPASLGTVADICLQIYGCEYQSLVANYIHLCQIMTLPVPYWPAPDNAPGSCSYNTGEVLEAALGSQTSELSCTRNAESLSLSEIPCDGRGLRLLWDEHNYFCVCNFYGLLTPS